jgi:FkbM family methyltransferase
MSKIKDSKVVIDIIKQSKNNLLIKIQFFLAFLMYYSMKKFGFVINYFPKLDIVLYDCYFKAREKTIDFWVLWKNYEKEIFREINKIKQKGTFIDVGANIGRYSILMAKKGWKVYSFEPVRNNFEKLMEHIKINNVQKNVQAKNAGLGKNNLKKKIYYLPYKYGEASIILSKKESNSEEIHMDKLDNFVKKNYKKPIILKIDVEGFEFEVLKGSKKFIKKHHPIIILEMWNKERERDINFLEKIGYKNKGDFWYYTK